MANLETLEMTINANAQSASKGLGKLIGSLSILSAKVSSAASSMKQLNSELKSLQNFKNVKLPGMLGGAYDSSHTTGAQRTVRNIKQVNSALQEHINTVTGINRVSKNAKNSAMWMDRLLSGQEFASRTVAAASSSKAFKAVPSVMKEYQKEDISQWQSWRYGPNKPRVFNNNGYTPEQLAESNRKAEEDRARYYRELAEVRASMKSGGENATWVEDNIKATASFNKLAENLYGTKKTANSAKTAVKQVAEVATKAVEKTKTVMEDVVGKRNQSTDKGSFFERMKEGFNNMTSGFSRFTSRIGRIASTMLMRKALKALVAAAKEGTENLYQYSKGLGGEFASSMDRMASSMAQLKNAAGTAIAPALSAIIPVLNAISSAAITAFNALSQLFALLGGKGTWTKATAVVNEYAEATEKAGGGGGGLKEMLADFDELNVIASESGGGGGGGGSGIDYADMFEEVSVFSQEIKDIVEWIQTHMDSILGMALAIGTAILGWKVSEAFTGLLSTLGGLIAGGAVIAVTCQAVWLMDNQYFKDKNPGWLIGDMLVSAVGAALAGKIVGSVLGGSAGLITAAITLELSALTTIIALLKNTDVSPLSQEGILASAVAALKAGAGIAILNIVSGLGMMNAVLTGISGAFLVFGVTVGLKTILSDDIEVMSLDHIKGAITSAIGVGAAVGLYLLAFLGKADTALAMDMSVGMGFITLGAVVGIKAIVGNVETFSAENIEATLFMGGAIGAGVFKMAKGMNYTFAEALNLAGGVALVTIGAAIGIKAIFDDKVENFSAEHIMAAAISALGVGSGAYLIVKSGLTRIASESAAAFGIGMGLVTLGVAIGLKAVFSEDVELLDEEHVKAAIIGAGAVGAGMYWLSKNGVIAGVQNSAEAGLGFGVLTLGVLITLKAIVGAVDKGELTDEALKESLFGVAATGAGAALVAKAFGAGAAAMGVTALVAAGITVGVLVTVKAILASIDKKKTKINLTDEEVQKFVDEQLFNADIKVRCNVIAENVALTVQERANIEMALLKALGTFKVIRMGIATSNDYTQLKTDVESVIGEVQKYIDSVAEQNKLVIQFTPSLVGNTSEEQQAWYNNSSSGWGTVSEFFASKGKELGDILVENEKGQIVAKNPELLQTLMQQIENVTSAITKSKIKAGASTNLAINLRDLDNDTIGRIGKVYSDYTEELTKEYTKLEQEAIINQESLVAALFEINPDSAEYKKAVKDLATMKANFLSGESVKREVEAAAKEGKEVLESWLTEQYSGIYSGSNRWENILRDGEYTPEALQEAIYQIFADKDIPKEAIDIMELIEFTGWDLLSTEMQADIIYAMSQSVDGVNSMKDLLHLSVSDIVSTVNWELFEDYEKTNFVWSLLGAYGSQETLGILKDQLKISINDLVTIVGWDNLEEWQRAGLVNGLVAAYGSAETIAILKDRCKMSAADIVGITNWAAFTSQQQLEFTAALSNAFGAETALNAAKNAGVNILKLVAQGMNSDNEAIRKAAMEWKGIIESIVPHIDVELSYHVTVTSNGKVDKVDTTTYNVGSSVRNPEGRSIGGRGVSVALDAGGAYDISRGDLFIANEAGAELVGSINGKTSVANQGQIIEGIQKGVRDANAEQNALLRQQNDLLRSILEKDNSVRIGASAALGRIVNQSTAMYNKAAGLGGV